MSFYTGTDIDVERTINVDIAGATTVEIHFVSGAQVQYSIAATVLTAATGEVRATLTPAQNLDSNQGTWYDQVHVVQAGGEVVKGEIRNIEILRRVEIFQSPVGL
jgi:hypothetical protein